MHRMIEQSSVHLPELVKDIGRPVSIYLVHLSRTRNLVEEPSPEVQQHQPYEHLEGVWVREQRHPQDRPDEHAGQRAEDHRPR
jgi:hypothetical protein